MEHLIVQGKFKFTPIQDTDIDFIFRGLSDNRVTRYYAIHFDTLEETAAQMEWYRDLRKTSTGLWWVIEDLRINQLVAAGGYNDMSTNQRTAEIGFWVLPEFWGKGIMRSCFPIIVDYGLRELKLVRIEGYVESDNEACKNALSKTDFEFERRIVEFDERKQAQLNIDLYAIDLR